MREIGKRKKCAMELTPKTMFENPAKRAQKAYIQRSYFRTSTNAIRCLVFLPVLCKKSAAKVASMQVICRGNIGNAISN